MFHYNAATITIHPGSYTGRYTIISLHDAFIIRRCGQRVFCCDRRAEKNSRNTWPSYTFTGRGGEHRWRLFATLQKSPSSVLFHLSHIDVFPLSGSNIQPFHYFEVEMRSLMLDRLSELPAGLGYAGWRETLHLSRYPACTLS